jgi:hypothetical protein
MTTDLLEQAETEVEEILGHPPPVPFDVHPAADKQRIISETERQLGRLRELYSAFHDRALQGDAKAADVCLKISDREAKLLGLDAPDKLAIAASPGIVQLLAGVHDKRMAKTEVLEAEPVRRVSSGEHSYKVTMPNRESKS